MKRKNRSLRCWIILTLVAAGYHVIAFGVPFARGKCFYISWLFTLAAFVFQVCGLSLAFVRGEEVKDLLYGEPIVRIGSLFLILQISLSFVFMGIGTITTVPNWIPIVLFSLVLCAAAQLLIASSSARDEAIHQDIRQNTSTARMRGMQTQIAIIATAAPQGSIDDELRGLMEQFRFSDPVSSEDLTAIETQLEGLIAQIRTACASRNELQIHELCQLTQNVLDERNQLCRTTKA